MGAAGEKCDFMILPDSKVTPGMCAWPIANSRRVAFGAFGIARRPSLEMPRVLRAPC